MRYWLIMLVIFSMLSISCSHMIIVKECKQVDGEDISVCKTMKPWE